MLKDLFFIITVLGSFVLHQIHLVCDEYSKDCPDVSEYDLIAKIPLVRNIGKNIYFFIRISPKALLIASLLGKACYYVLFTTFLHIFVFSFFKKIFNFGLIFFLAISISVILLSSYSSSNFLKIF